MHHHAYDVMMRMFIIIFTALLAGSSAFAASTERREWNPPTRFDHPFVGKLIAVQLPREQVLSLCAKEGRKYGLGPVTRGCAIRDGKGACKIIYIDRPHNGTSP